MLSKRIAVPCPVEILNTSDVVVELQIPLPLTAAELASALYWGAPPECDPEEFSDSEVSAWVVQGVLCEGYMKVANTPPKTCNDDDREFLAMCERRIARYAASMAQPAARSRRRVAAQPSAVAA